MTGPVGETGYVKLLETRVLDCDGTRYGPFDVSLDATWSSTNTSVVTVGSVSSNGVFCTCVGVGQANVHADFQGTFSEPDPLGSGCNTTFVPFPGDCPTNVVEVHILQNGADITNTTQDVIVGEKISLTAEVQPSGTTFTNQQWTVPGSRVANYVATLSSGTLTPLSNLAGSSVDFYWVDGGDGRQVQYSITIDGIPLGSAATFNVKRPTATVTTSTGTIAVRSEGTACVLRFGNPTTHGIDFSSSLQLPQGFSGAAQWVQIVTVNRSFKDTSNNCWQFSATGLDTTYPYDSASSTEDSPGSILESDQTTQNVSDSFQMWLMFRPPGGIWIPLRVVSWGWSASARQDGSGCSGWTIVSSSKTAVSVSDTTEHPRWSLAITDCCTYAHATCP
jgi:hypothetical protein